MRMGSKMSLALRLNLHLFDLRQLLHLFGCYRMFIGPKAYTCIGCELTACSQQGGGSEARCTYRWLTQRERGTKRGRENPLDIHTRSRHGHYLQPSHTLTVERLKSEIGGQSYR